LHPFFFTEGGAKAVFVLRGNSGEFTKHLVSSLREVQSVIAAIFGAPPALDDSLGFEFIDQRDHAAGHDPEMLRQCLLADARIGRDLPEQSRIWSRQPNLRNSFCKTTRAMCPHLG
jgi:hypothetical protein